MKVDPIASNGHLLIIFFRNPALGKVKTRLAKTLGDARALAVYIHLAAHTKNITENLEANKAVYYSHHVDTEDNWDNFTYKKFLQTGENLGERMANAFREGFRSGYKSICIIGTDCLELTTQVIDEAFTSLQGCDVVIGPATDGGYYLLGMKSFHPEFFENKQWSTSVVRKETIRDCNAKGLLCHQLVLLSDVDEAKDLPEELTRL